MAFFDEPYPYIVPVNYGFEWKDTLIFYLHTAPDGHKNQLLRKSTISVGYDGRRGDSSELFEIVG